VSRLLLDTHIWLWSLGSPERVSPAVRSAIVEATEVVLSVASIWEVGVKHTMGKLPLRAGVRALVDEAVRELRARVLPIDVGHASEAAELPWFGLRGAVRRPGRWARTVERSHRARRLVDVRGAAW